MSDDFEQQEYFALVKAVDDFDQRLITIKGWGVTLSLVALGLGFQYSAYGFFLVAAASSFAFWFIEGTVKRHQMRYYPRMREIEVNRYVSQGVSPPSISSPRIDWSWHRAAAILSGKIKAGSDVAVSLSGPDLFYRLPWVLPHVALRNFITFVIGLVLFWRGIDCHLSGFSLGSHAK